jgi:hypothetical protein
MSVNVRTPSPAAQFIFLHPFRSRIQQHPGIRSPVRRTIQPAAVPWIALKSPRAGARQPFLLCFGSPTSTASLTVGPCFREITRPWLFSRRRRTRASGLSGPRARYVTRPMPMQPKSQTIGFLRSSIVKAIPANETKSASGVQGWNDRKGRGVLAADRLGNECGSLFVWHLDCRCPTGARPAKAAGDRPQRTSPAMVWRNSSMPKGLLRMASTARSVSTSFSK